MPKHIELTIQEPCHENWEKMNTTEKGRFCNSCQKQVIDFTGMSDEKLVAFFRKPSTQVCGRFRNDQLQKDLTIPQKRIPWVSYFFQVALPAVLFSGRGYTQREPMKKPVALLLQQQKPTLAEMEKNTQAPKARVLTGKVIDSQGHGISYASIWRKNLSQGSATDSLGFFRLTLNENDSLEVIEVSHTGYISRSIKIDLAKENFSPAICLEKEELNDVVLMGVVAAPIIKPVPVIIPETKSHTLIHFKVFPNPVISGTSLNIELVNKLKEGYYNLQVAALDGRIVYQKEIWIDAEARVMNIELPSIAAGNYIISLGNRKTGKVFGEKVVIQ
jgi:hypothetical protein